MNFKSETNNTITPRYILISGVAFIFSWLLHEFAHWITGTALGYNMVMTFNSGYPLNLQYAEESHYHIISAAGPIITLIEAFIVFVLMRQGQRKMLYPFLFICFYMRLFATLISFLKLNDEARISKSLSLGTFTLPILVSGVLLYLVYSISNQYGFSKKFNLKNLGLVIFYSSIIILADQFFHFRLL